MELPAFPRTANQDAHKMNVWKIAAEKLQAEAEMAKAELAATKAEAERIMDAARQVEAQAAAKVAAAQDELLQIRAQLIDEDQRLQRVRADYRQLCADVEALVALG